MTGEGGALLSGIVLALGGYASGVFGNGIPLLTMAWTPWVAWGALRTAHDPRKVFALPALAGAQILSGDPAGMVTSLLLSIAVAAALAPSGRRLRALAVLAGAWIGAALLAAVSLAPALAFLSQTERAAGLGLDVAGVWSMHPLSLLALVWPGALGDPTEPARDLARLVADESHGLAQGTSWALDHHAGAIVLILAILAVRRREARPAGPGEGPSPLNDGTRALAACAVGFIVLALGVHTPIYAAYRAIFPPERFLRFPEKHIVGALVLGTALAGVGFSRAFAEARRRALVGSLAAAGVFAAGLAALAIAGPRLVVALSSRVDEAHRFVDPGAALAHVAAGGRMALAAIALFAAGLLVARARPRAGAALGFTAATALTIVHAVSLQSLVDRDFVATPPEVLAPALGPSADGVRPRLYRPPTSRLPAGLSRLERTVLTHETATEDIAAGFGLADVPGADAAYERHYAGFLADARARGDSTPRLLAMFGVRWALVPDDEVAALGGVARAHAYGFTLVELPAARPYAFTDPSHACTVRRPRPERIELTCDADSDASRAVALEAWSPGWSATVDGAPAEATRADVLFLAAPVPAGRHQVVFTYHTPGLTAGAAISAVALVAFLLLRRRYSVALSMNMPADP
jgi:hypothetical protein